MHVEIVAQAAYIVAALLFILSLAGLSKHESSRQGIVFGIGGMTIAVAATIVLAIKGANGTAGLAAGAIGLIAIAMVIGAVLGLLRARSVAMTGMPELIAMLHSFVGLAAVLVGWNGYYEVESKRGQTAALTTALNVKDLTTVGTLLKIHHAEVFIGVFIGAVTFTGSIIAFLKLSARMPSAPLVLPGRNALNLGALVVFLSLIHISEPTR